jgi:carboxyl-terminal processing protease
MMAKVSSKGPYTGKLVVLVDSNSGSASELFARFMQLQQRGVVIGDRSAGAVMQSRSIPMELGTDSIVPYGMSLTNADVILADGLSLEHVGVTPHFMLFPSAEDLAARRDPVLAAALKLLGQEVSPQDAGKAFPVVWEEN